MQNFRPGKAPSDPKQLPEWLDRQMLGIQRAAQDANDSVNLRELANEPARPQVGALYIADGTNWNPGDGKGTYRYEIDATTGLGSYVFLENAGGGGGAQHLYGFFPGTTQNIIGIQRIFPLIGATLVKLSAWAEVGVPYDTTVSLRINGAVIATATILAGNTTGDSGAISVAQVSTDYNTADLVSAGSSNVGFRADYA